MCDNRIDGVYFVPLEWHWMPGLTIRNTDNQYHFRMICHTTLKHSPRWVSLENNYSNLGQQTCSCCWSLAAVTDFFLLLTISLKSFTLSFITRTTLGSSEVKWKETQPKQVANFPFNFFFLGWHRDIEWYRAEHLNDQNKTKSVSPQHISCAPFQFLACWFSQCMDCWL